MDRKIPTHANCKRCFVTAECTGTALIVAGGHGENFKELTTVEVLNIENRQWSTAADLPEPLQYHSATVCGDQLYMLGGAHHYLLTKSVYTCSVSALLQTCTQRSLVELLKCFVTIQQQQWWYRCME